MNSFRQKRANLSAEQLARYRCKWVAFTLDDGKLVAGSENLTDLDELLRAAGEDPEKVALEYIGEDDAFVAGAESC